MKINSGSPIINWWLQGLNLLVPDRLKKLFYPVKERILIQLQGDQLAVIWPNQKNRPQHTLAQSAQHDQYNLHNDNEQNMLSLQLAKYNTDQYDIVLCMPAKKGLRNVIKLPLNAEADLTSILQFEIERQTPFTRDQVYSGYQLVSKNQTANTLNVELNVIPKKQLDPQLAKLLTINIKPQVVELLTDQDQPGVNVLPNTTTDNKNGNQSINQKLALLTFVLFAVVAILPFRNLETALKQTESDIEKTRVEAMEVNQLQDKWREAQDKQNFVNKKINEYRSVVLILEEITQLLPDNTWLRRLQINEENIRLQGESAAATALISIIENSNNFSNTRFQSPVTSNISTGNDRFQITTQSLVIPVQTEESE